MLISIVTGSHAIISLDVIRVLSTTEPLQALNAYDSYSLMKLTRHKVFTMERISRDAASFVSHENYCQRTMLKSQMHRTCNIVKPK